MGETLRARERPWSLGVVMARRATRDGAVRTLVFAVVFGLYAWLQAFGYRGAYPSLADRLAFAGAFAHNDALRLFYGYPYDVVTVGGYCAWRVGGTLSIAAAVFGVMSAVRALRAEEDAGRAELVLAGAVRRSHYFLAAVLSVLLGALALGAGELGGYLAGGLALGPSMYAALATALVVPVFAGLGALASQLAPTRRGALALSLGGVGTFWLARMVADTWAPAAWLRTITPLGWAESMRPFAGSRADFALPSLALSGLTLLGAGVVARTRDVGVGLAAPRDRARSHRGWLGGPTRQYVLVARGSLAAWATGFGVFAFVLGMVSTSISSAGVSPELRRQLQSLGLGSVFTPGGYLAFVFVVFIVALTYFVSAQMAAARQEEADQALETLLAQPVDRRRWLLGRQLVAALGSLGLAGEVGLLAWLGAATRGANVSLGQMLEAGANTLPTAILFLGLASLLYALVPRASSAVSYALASVAFLWYVVGSLLHVPRWLVDATPYVHVGYVPAEAFRPVPAFVMLGAGLLTGVAATLCLARRDLLSA